MPISSNDIDPTWQDGVLITDTFDVWRKKTNGYIANYSPIITNANIADNTIQSIKLAAPAPTWDQTTGTVTTNGTVGALVVKGGFTSGLTSSINVSATASLTPALNITSSTQHLRFNPNSTVGAWNPLVAVGDYSIIGGATAGDTKNIIIGKWSSNAHGIVISPGRVGINKIAATDAFEVNGNISASASITGGSLSAGSGTISTTGTISGGAIASTSLSAGSGTISTTGAITGGSITGTSLSAGSGAIGTTGAITGGSLSAGSGTISTTGAITGGSLSAGSGTISTTGAITGGSITGTSLSAGSGTISTTGAITGGSFNSTSSLRYKQNVQPLCNALDIIEKLQGVTFDWKETGQSDIGLIAEQVNQVVPEFVLKDQEGLPQAVDYGKLTSILIEAVKELSALVKSQN